MITFLHGADFHLDSPFHALSPDQAAERRQEQRQHAEALRRVQGALRKNNSGRERGGDTACLCK